MKTKVINNHLITINPNSENELICYGYKQNVTKVLLKKILIIITLGMFDYLLKKFVKFDAWFFYQVSDLSNADYVLVLSKNKTYNLCQIEIKTIGINNKNYPEDEKLYIHDQTKRYFIHQNVFYIWTLDGTTSSMTFKNSCGLDECLTVSRIYELSTGIEEDVRKRRLNGVGPNTMDIGLKSFYKLLLDQVIDPFYFLQVFSVCLWIADEYYTFAGVIALSSVISVIISAYQTRKHLKRLEDVASNATKGMVNIYCNQTKSLKEVDVCTLVPGDVLFIPNGDFRVPCDAVMISGQCIVNESMLTGESFPTTKTPIVEDSDDSNSFYSTSVEKRHSLYCGTQVLQTRFYKDGLVLALVIKTGFTTLKGEMLRSILYPKPSVFRFFTDSLIFVTILFFIAMILCGYSIHILSLQGVGTGLLVKKILDIITIVVPPSLPILQNVNLIFAASRLIKYKVSCIIPSSIAVSGKVNLICFDKTGTLTSDGLELRYVFIPDKGSTNSNDFECFDDASKINDKLLVEAMASCHNLTYVRNQVVGDPLDLKMFEFVNWELIEPHEKINEDFPEETTAFESLNPVVVRPNNKKPSDYDSTSCQIKENSTLIEDGNLEPGKFYNINELLKNNELSIYKKFPFDSVLQRMSVIAFRPSDDAMIVYTKGAPEKIAKLCDPASLPSNYDNQIISLGKKGLRTLSVAYKVLPSNVHWHKVRKIQRNQVECDLIFLGLLVFENSIKEDSGYVIKQLKKAQIRCIMATGDGILTATSIGYEGCLINENENVYQLIESEENDDKNNMYNIQKMDILNNHTNDYSKLHINLLPKDAHLAMTGHIYESLRNGSDQDVFKYLLMRSTIFARMSPDNKTKLIEDLQSIGYTVAMCGDGANDCGALRSAHIGLAISPFDDSENIKDNCCEASLASPFTAHDGTLKCIPFLLAEGRATLDAAFSMFKYLILYSSTQATSVVILYAYGSNLSQSQFFIVDMIYSVILSLGIIRSRPSSTLNIKRPKGRLLCVHVFFSILVGFSIQLLTQYVAITLVGKQNWYQPVIIQTDELIFMCHDNASIMLVSTAMYIFQALAVVFYPIHREPFFYNRHFVVAFLLEFMLLLIFSFQTATKLRDVCSLADLPSINFRLILFFFGVIMGIFNVIAESFIERSLLVKYIINILRRKKTHKNLYKRLNNFSN